MELQTVNMAAVKCPLSAHFYLTMKSHKKTFCLLRESRWPQVLHVNNHLHNQAPSVLNF